MKVQLSAAQKVRILNTKQLYAIMREVLLREHMIDRDKEHFWVVSLKHNNTLVNIELISMGNNRATFVEVLDVFSIALQKRSAKIILVHNHPGGALLPSVPDLDVTDRLIQSGELLDTPVIDHLIITEKSYYSFADNGIMKGLKARTKYPLDVKERERLLAAAVAKGKLQVAAALKAQGVEASVIAKATGLSLAKVRALKG